MKKNHLSILFLCLLTGVSCFKKQGAVSEEGLADKQGQALVSNQNPNGNQNTTTDAEDSAADLDKDKDGISNEKDQCPDTPAGSLVDEKGCVSYIFFGTVTPPLYKIALPQDTVSMSSLTAKWDEQKGKIIVSLSYENAKIGSKPVVLNGSDSCALSQDIPLSSEKGDAQAFCDLKPLNSIEAKIEGKMGGEAKRNLEIKLDLNQSKLVIQDPVDFGQDNNAVIKWSYNVPYTFLMDGKTTNGILSTKKLIDKMRMKLYSDSPENSTYSPELEVGLEDKPVTFKIPVKGLLQAKPQAMQQWISGPEIVVPHSIKIEMFLGDLSKKELGTFYSGIDSKNLGFVGFIFKEKVDPNSVKDSFFFEKYDSAKTPIPYTIDSNDGVSFNIQLGELLKEGSGYRIGFTSKLKRENGIGALAKEMATLFKTKGFNEKPSLGKDSHYTFGVACAGQSLANRSDCDYFKSHPTPFVARCDDATHPNRVMVGIRGAQGDRVDRLTTLLCQSLDQIVEKASAAQEVQIPMVGSNGGGFFELKAPAGSLFTGFIGTDIEWEDLPSVGYLEFYTMALNKIGGLSDGTEKKIGDVGSDNVNGIVYNKCPAGMAMVGIEGSSGTITRGVRGICRSVISGSY